MVQQTETLNTNMLLLNGPKRDRKRSLLYFGEIFFPFNEKSPLS